MMHENFHFIYLYRNKWFHLVMDDHRLFDIKKLRKKTLVWSLSAGQWTRGLLSYSATTFVEGCTVHLCVTLLCGCQVKDFFSKAKVPVDAKYIDPTYMIRALPCNSSDHIVCSILGQNAVCTLSLSFSFFTLCLVFHLPVIIYAGNLFRDNVLLCTPYVI